MDMSALKDRLAEALARRERQAASGERVSKAALARACGVKSPSVADWFSGQTHSLEGSNLVRAADYLRVNPTWLATGRGRMEPNAPALIGAGELTVVDPDDVLIPQFATGGAMGGGLVLRDQPGVIHSWHVSEDWIRRNVKHFTAVRNLCIVTGFGDSMRPMFNPGDPLLVDRGIRTVEFDAVYFFRVDGEGFIKRLQRIPGEGLRVLSANRDHYEPWTIKKGMDFEVLGRVLKVWCSEDF